MLAWHLSRSVSPGAISLLPGPWLSYTLLWEQPAALKTDAFNVVGRWTTNNGFLDLTVAADAAMQPITEELGIEIHRKEYLGLL